MVGGIAAAHSETSNHEKILVYIVDELTTAMQMAEEAGLTDLIDPLQRIFDEAQRELVLRNRMMLPS